MSEEEDSASETPESSDEASKDCPYCQKHVGEDCEHLLAYLDLTFRQFLAGRAEELFGGVYEGEEDEFDERFDSFDEACCESADHSENCDVEGGPGDSCEESIHWAKNAAQAGKILANLLRAK